MNPLQAHCSPKCALEYNRQRKVKELRENLKTLGDYEKVARTWFHKFIRMRDEGRPCISCGTTTASIWDAGHYLKAEIYTGLIFNEKNVHRQCGKCNRFLGGNELNYRDGLLARYGLDYVVSIEEKRDYSRVYKFTKQELIDIANLYKTKCKNEKENH